MTRTKRSKPGGGGRGGKKAQSSGPTRTTEAQLQAGHKKTSRKNRANQKFHDERSRETVDQDVQQVLGRAKQDGKDEEEDDTKREGNPFVYPTPSADEQKQAAAQMDKNLEALTALMK